jgi:hypothetical protein
MPARSAPLRSTAGRNSRKRPPLDPEQIERAQTFARRVLNGTSKILGGENAPAPVAHASGPQYWSVGTYVDGDLEYTVQVLVTRRRDSLNPNLLP